MRRFHFLAMISTFILRVVQASSPSNGTSVNITFPEASPNTFSNGTYIVHNITRFADYRFENLAIRSNGQILTVTATPSASIYQVDPLGIVPPALLYTVPNVGGMFGLQEGEPNLFYTVVGSSTPFPVKKIALGSYAVYEIDVRGVHVLPDGTLSRKPAVREIAHLPQCQLANGVAFTRPRSKTLLVTDSFAGLIWKVDTCDGSVGVALNDSSTGGNNVINGLKVHNGTMYYTGTGSQTLWKTPIGEDGVVPAGENPILITSNLTCDDLVVDAQGTAYVASPDGIVTRVTSAGEKQVIAGTFDSTHSDLMGPTALAIGQLESDRWSLYITTNGGSSGNSSGVQGVSRIDVEDYAVNPLSSCEKGC